MDDVKVEAPEHCRECEHLTVFYEDNRFDAWGPGTSGTYGDIDAYPGCNLSEERCPDEFKGCPIIQENSELIEMLPEFCQECAMAKDCHFMNNKFYFNLEAILECKLNVPDKVEEETMAS